MDKKTIKLGIIGGSGLYNFDELENKKILKTKQGAFGKPSSDVQYGSSGNIEVFFIPRHGINHEFSPSNVPYRANIETLKSLGCNDLLSVSAVGSLKEELSPGTFILVNQYIDRTYKREKTFFDNNIVAHVSMANPTCKITSDLVAKSAKEVGINIVEGGVYLVMEGPQFSSKAESNLYRSWGCDVIGMTNMPEAKLAREAEMRYTSIAMVTDYDCWRENENNVDVEEIIKTLKENGDKAKKLIKSFISVLENYRTNHVIDGIDNVLDSAIITSNHNENDILSAGLENIMSRFLNVSQ